MAIHRDFVGEIRLLSAPQVTGKFFAKARVITINEVAEHAEDDVGFLNISQLRKDLRRVRILFRVLAGNFMEQPKIFYHNCIVLKNEDKTRWMFFHKLNPILILPISFGEIPECLWSIGFCVQDWAIVRLGC